MLNISLDDHHLNRKVTFSVYQMAFPRAASMQGNLTCDYLNKTVSAGNLTVTDLNAYFKKSEASKEKYVQIMTENLQTITTAILMNKYHRNEGSHNSSSSLAGKEDTGTYSASGHSLNRLSDKITGKNLDYSTSDLLQRDVLKEAIGSKNGQ